MLQSSVPPWQAATFTLICLISVLNETTSDKDLIV